MKNRGQAAWMLLVCGLGMADCGDSGSPRLPTIPSSGTPQSPQPVPQPIPMRPSVTSVTPNIVSTAGDAWGTITGADFQPGAGLRLGDLAVRPNVLDSSTIQFSTPAHAPGTVDVVVTNPGGLSGTLAGGYTFARPDSFDFNGDWIAHAGPDYENDMRFTVRSDVLVSLSCGTTILSLPSRVPIAGATFSIVDDGLAVTGRMVSTITAVGTIDVAGCVSTRWWADKSSEADRLTIR